MFAIPDIQWSLPILVPSDELTSADVIEIQKGPQ